MTPLELDTTAVLDDAALLPDGAALLPDVAALLLEDAAVLLGVTLLDVMVLDDDALEGAALDPAPLDGAVPEETVCEVTPAMLVEDPTMDALEDATDNAEEPPAPELPAMDDPLDDATAPPLELDASTRGWHTPSWHSLPRSHSWLLLQVLRQMLSCRTKPSGHGAHAAEHSTNMRTAGFTAACTCFKRAWTALRMVRAA